MAKQILSEEFLRMQKLAGIITEEQYSKKIEEVSISGTLGKIKDKILNLPVFQKLIDTIVSKMSKEDIEKFKAKFSLNEAEGGPSLEDVFAKVNALNPDKNVKEPEDLKEELDRDSFLGKVVNLVRNLTGLNLMALGGAPLGYFVAAALGLPGIGLFAGALISLVASLIIHGISRKLLGMSGDDGLVGEIAEEQYMNEGAGIEQFEDYVSDMFNMAIPEDAEEGEYFEEVFEKSEYGDEEEYDTEEWYGLTDYLKSVGGKATLEGNPDINLELMPNGDIKFGATVTFD